MEKNKKKKRIGEQDKERSDISGKNFSERFPDKLEIRKNRLRVRSNRMEGCLSQTLCSSGHDENASDIY